MVAYLIFFGVALAALLFIFGTGWPSEYSIFSKRHEEDIRALKDKNPREE